MAKELNYTFTCTAAPVQAEGTVFGRPFYFRERHEHWGFAVSEEPDIDPIDIQTSEQGHAHGFLPRSEESFAASYRPLEEAERIIGRCAEMYLRMRTGGEI